MKRLDAVCSLIEPADRIADVGCDHGAVAEYCADRMLANTVIASDISEACLAKARAKLDGRENVIFVRCDGICYDCDEAIISGMGGGLISDIIVNAHALPSTLVLCPHRDADRVRRTLYRSGYAIDRDMLIKDGRRFYFIIRAKLGRPCAEPDELEYLYGTQAQENKELLLQYLMTQYNIFSVAPERNADKLKPITAALARLGARP